MFRVAADAVVFVHLAFVAFAVLGGFLAIHRPRVAWVHLPAAAWGAWIEFAGWTCPLTPLENWLRAKGGGERYAGDFVERYLLPILYPDALTPELQWALGCGVVLINLAAYLLAVRRAREMSRVSVSSRST
jgi:hypothetical protein